MKKTKIPKITQIDKNVPIPPKMTRSNGKYPYIGMEVQDSFFLSSKSENNIKSVKSSVCQFNKRNKDGLVFLYRVVPNGVRVWRIK